LLCVVFIPDMELTTTAARDVVAQTFSRQDAVYNASRCALLIRAIAEKDYATLGTAMEDRWHQGPREALMPAMPDVIAAALDAGASGSCLAGAGPSILALTYRDPAAVQTAMAAAASAHGIDGHSVVSRVRNYGARVDTSV
jgi:homoserine kinase